MINRLRRTRRNNIIRELVAETRIAKDMFVYPIFVVAGTKVKKEIPAMPGVFHFSVDRLITEVRELLELGINKLLLFGVGENKTPDGSSSFHDEAIVVNAVREIKKAYGSGIFVITDVCVCAYTTHGHCGILKEGEVDNDPSVDILAKMALKHAQAGADMVAPSDMMDGRVDAIRELLDDEGYQNIGIMSYAVKFASAYYGPFREAADSAPQQGDRKAYQMDYRNGNEAIREAVADEMEGADIIMVKPALAYLDVIKEVKQNTLLPVACYNVSGEYSMVKTAANAGLIDEQKLVMENMHAFARAGASIIITYHAKDIVLNNWI
jgi:porphobilinogen synthase